MTALREKVRPWDFTGGNINHLYWPMLDTIEREGELVRPRGLATKELLHAVTTITRPRERVLTVYGRQTNPFFSLAECVWILGGRSDADWICFFNSRLRQVLDPLQYPSHDGKHFHGAYGFRLRGPRDQLLDCYNLLRENPESRQAVMTLWNPQLDNPTIVTLDRPCNIAVLFKVRRKRLWMTVINRSNDAVLGLTATNVVQFSTLQETLASWLGIDVGPQTHFSDSLHLYLEDPFSPGKAPPCGQRTPAFNVYDYVRPVAMAGSTPVRQAQLIEALLSLPRILETGVLQPRPALDELDTCPYWESVGFAIAAFCAHKQKEPEWAISAVANMGAHDWRLECLRWLADRYVKRDDWPKLRQAIVQAARPFIANEAVASYVFQGERAFEPVSGPIIDDSAPHGAMPPM